MSVGVEIRGAILGDAAAIAELERVCMPVPWSEDGVRGSLSLATTRAWLLTERDEAVGYLLTQQLPGSAEILTVGVAPGHRRRGLARKLLGVALDHWRKSDVEEVFLDVRDDNVAARGLYEALGFQVVGRRRSMYADGTDALQMRWSP